MQLHIDSSCIQKLRLNPSLTDPAREVGHCWGRRNGSWLGGKADRMTADPCSPDENPDSTFCIHPAPPRNRGRVGNLTDRSCRTCIALCRRSAHGRWHTQVNRSQQPHRRAHDPEEEKAW